MPRLHEIPTLCVQGATVNTSISCLLNNGASANFQEVLGGGLRGLCDPARCPHRAAPAQAAAVG